MALFAVTYTYAPELSEQREANKPPHRAWLADQVEAGRVLSVGPYPDGGGALVVITASDIEDARALLAEDPHATEGLIAETGIREWTPVFGAFS